VTALSARGAQPGVFLSHATEDAQLVELLCAGLESAGIPCWVAPRDVRPGFHYGEEIVQAIEESRAMILVLSRFSNDSPAVASEIEQAFRDGRRIIPVRIENVEPSKRLRLFVGQSHRLDAVDGDIQAMLPQLINALLHMAPASKPPPSLPRAVAPASAPPRGWGSPLPGALKLRRAVLGVAAGGVLLVVLELATLGRGEIAPAGMLKIAGAEVELGFNRREAWQQLQKAISTKNLDHHAVAAHKVRLAPYFIDRWEVSNGRYAEFVRSCRSERDCPGVDRSFQPGPESHDRPVQQRTYAEASAYCHWVGGRLPTGNEWEYAGRGPKLSLFPWGDTPHLTGDWATVSDIGVRRGDQSELGVSDLAGNVAEWVQDESPCRASDPSGQVCRSLRGLAGMRHSDGRVMFTPGGALPLFYAHPAYPKLRFDGTGFRCARDVSPLNGLYPYRLQITTVTLMATVALLLLLTVGHFRPYGPKAAAPRGSAPPPSRS
jgi:formylglycine-generating enzyme required for sulfatase activity